MVDPPFDIHWRLYHWAMPPLITFDMLNFEKLGYAPPPSEVMPPSATF